MLRGYKSLVGCRFGFSSVRSNDEVVVGRVSSRDGMNTIREGRGLQLSAKRNSWLLKREQSGGVTQHGRVAGGRIDAVVS